MYCLYCDFSCIPLYHLPLYKLGTVLFYWIDWMLIVFHSDVSSQYVVVECCTLRYHSATWHKHIGSAFDWWAIWIKVPLIPHYFLVQVHSVPHINVTRKSGFTALVNPLFHSSWVNVDLLACKFHWCFSPILFAFVHCLQEFLLQQS